MKRLFQVGVSVIVALTLSLGMTACSESSRANYKTSDDGSNWGKIQSRNADSNTNSVHGTDPRSDSGSQADSGSQSDTDSQSDPSTELMPDVYPNLELPSDDPLPGSVTYEVGKDIQAGEYVIIAQSSMFAMFVIYNNMSKSRSDIVTLDLFRNRTIVTVKEGEFLEVVIG
ncbi:MAG: hypothetical protein LBG68_02740, partial [Coriobacteriales bacterium]|nr:hypothetical protein [Coriobacteriales bacterium]